VLSGDHIYKMNYDKMLDYHKAQGAAATIAVMPVSMEEASRFGIMITDEENKIIDFEEKPAHPRSTLASMGIYIFDWKKLRAILVKDMVDPDSAHDFGKTIIPTLLNGGEKLVAFKFEGYWKDVGTIDSLWEANMDLLDDDCDLNLDDPSWKIYTEDSASLPAYIGSNASIDCAYITQGTSIDGAVKNSVIFTDAKVGKDAKIIDSVLMPGVVVGDGAVVTRALVADGVSISAGSVVGSADSKNITLLANDI
jgi:glucose-1-phosphate adenylyltransferase